MNKKVTLIFGIFAVGYLTIGFPYIYSMSKMITDDYFNQIGKAALVAISEAAKHLEVTDDDVARLQSIEYKDLPFDKTNVAFENEIKRSANRLNAKYAYLMYVQDKAKYTVQEDDKDYYGAPVDTPLKVIWMLNVVFGGAKTTNADFIEQYAKDKDRYSYLRDTDVKVYMNKEESYLYSSDEFGEKYISAYAPFFTKEGKFIGMLGLDIFADQYINFKKTSNMILLSGGTVIFILMMMTGISYFKNKKNSQLLHLVSEKMVLDTLTGIYNRNGLDKFEKNNYMILKENGSPITAIMIDIDDFKDINDTYGHDVGDEVLMSVAKTLREGVRMPNDYPVRTGGDEFLIIFTNIGREDVISIANRLKDSITSKTYTKAQLKVALSIGISTTVGKKDAKLLADIRKEADEALYEAKKEGKNKVICYYEGIAETAHERKNDENA